MTDGPTTDRAQRQQAVATGAASDAVDRVSTGPNPGGGMSEGTPRSRQIATQKRIAGEVGVDPDGVATTDRRGGMDAFLRSSGTRQFASALREQFAGAADFVERADVAASVDPQDISGSAQVARGRRDDVAKRAREQTASEAQFVEPGDLNAEVTGRGVTDIAVPGARRDDVAARARQGLAADDPFAQPSDFEADVTAAGIESAGLTETGAERRAGRQFEAKTPLTDAGPDDVTRTGSGFALDDEAQRRVAARQFESESDVFASGELTPGDIRDTEGGFGLAEEPASELAAAELSEQVDGTVAPSDVTLSERDDGGFEAVFDRGGN